MQVLILITTRVPNSTAKLILNVNATKMYVCRKLSLPPHLPHMCLFPKPTNIITYDVRLQEIRTTHCRWNCSIDRKAKKSFHLKICFALEAEDVKTKYKYWVLWTSIYLWISMCISKALTYSIRSDAMNDKLVGHINRIYCLVGNMN